MSVFTDGIDFEELYLIHCFSWRDNGQMTVFKEVKVNSAVLAAKSLIVRKMMSSGIRDTTANSPIVLKMQQVGESVRLGLLLLFAGLCLVRQHFISSSRSLSCTENNI